LRGEKNINKILRRSMPDRYWCTSCDVGYTDVIPGACPHCGSSLVDMEGFEDEADQPGPQEYEDIEGDQDDVERDFRMDKKAA
jgi:hypothetical protein